jgi:hypothetical protein
MSRYIVYKPVVEPRAVKPTLAPRRGDLAGCRLGLLFNTKANADLVLHRVRERLAAAYPDMRFEWVRKPHASAAMTPENFAVLKALDGVVTGLGD